MTFEEGIKKTITWYVDHQDFDNRLCINRHRILRPILRSDFLCLLPKCFFVNPWALNVTVFQILVPLSDNLYEVI